MFRTRRYPQTRLLNDNVKQHRWWRTSLPKHPCITFISNGPRNQHGEGSHSLTVGGVLVHPIQPPSLDRIVSLPCSVDLLMEVKLFVKHVAQP